MEQKTIRLLRADEIECRIGTISEKGVSLLLYKDARADMKILDEVYGPLNWQRRHEMIGGSLYCTVSVWDDEKKQWISKMDVGTESYTEKEKGQASDSFKRACVSLGIGRELYSAPFIWVPASKVQIQKKNDKFYCRESFHVAAITYSGTREITGLSIINDKGDGIYEWKVPDKGAADTKEAVRKNPAEDKTAEKPADKKPSLTKKQMDGLATELKRTGVAMEAVQDRYHIDDPRQMSEELYNKVMRALSRTRSAA